MQAIHTSMIITASKMCARCNCPHLSPRVLHTYICCSITYHDITNVQLPSVSDFREYHTIACTYSTL